MIELVPKHAKIRCYQATFDAFSENEIFDGIWASFSLLHAKRKDLPRLLTVLEELLNRVDFFL